MNEYYNKHIQITLLKEISFHSSCDYLYAENVDSVLTYVNGLYLNSPGKHEQNFIEEEIKIFVWKLVLNCLRSDQYF